MRKFVAKSLKMRNVTVVQYGSSAGRLPANKLDWQFALEHNTGRFWIHPDVVLRGGRDISLAAGCASHDHASANFARDCGSLLQSHGDVCQWTQRNKN
jgi:hypothetical protein